MPSPTRLAGVLLLAILSLVFSVSASSSSAISFRDVKAQLEGRELVAFTSEKDLSSKKWQASALDKLIVNAVVQGSDDNPVVARHLILGVRSQKEKAETSFLCKSSQGGRRLTCVVDFKDAPTLETLHPGRNTLTLYAATLDATATYVLGDLDFAFKPVAKPESEFDVFRMLPEIAHTFRPDEKPANKLLSLVFTIGVLVPWVVLLGSYVALSANVQNLFANSLTATFGSLFIAALAAVMALYYVYWLRLNLFQLLGYGTVLAGVTAAFGRQALVAHAGIAAPVRTKKDL
ncbi:Oligosaccharyltransferase subunit Ribophorin II-domain-containing protein [Geranomyces variabilis]|nr:Oligosaccharyltransferase subunit Ribophorin II-domain-containing protein [Geranomyces variabilis]KAJ3139811.1 proteasome regulatory particle base subunit [Geranomyces variabilis]